MSECEHAIGRKLVEKERGLNSKSEDEGLLLLG